VAFQNILFEKKNAIAYVTVNRQNMLNAPGDGRLVRPEVGQGFL
jgi:hypothetical protein